MAGIDRHVFVVFGGTGDLARHKFVSSLYRLITENGVADRCVMLGAVTTDGDTDTYRAWARDVLVAAGLSEDRGQGVVRHQTSTTTRSPRTPIPTAPSDLSSRDWRTGWLCPGIESSISRSLHRFFRSRLKVTAKRVSPRVGGGRGWWSRSR